MQWRLRKRFRNVLFLISDNFLQHFPLSFLFPQIQDGSTEITTELALLELAVNFAASEVKERLQRALELAEIEHLFHIRAERC